MTNLVQIVELADKHEGFVLGSLTFLYLLTTIGLFIAARRANRLALRNVETLTQLEEERLRPVVICELLTETPFVMLRIQNLGQTTAKDVTVSITPPLRRLFGGDNAQPKEKSEKTIGFLEHGFRSLAPRQQVSTIVGSFQRHYCPVVCDSLFRKSFIMKMLRLKRCVSDLKTNCAVFYSGSIPIRLRHEYRTTGFCSDSRSDSPSTISAMRHSVSR